MGEVRIVPRSEMNFSFEAYPQAKRLLTIHETLGGGGPGRRRDLEILNKSAIVMTCAFWEAFVEDLATDVLEHLAEHATSARDLSADLRISILNELRREKNELAMWEIADGEWRNILRRRARKITEAEDRGFSSPRSRKIDEFLQNTSGITKLFNSWRWPGTSAPSARSRLDKFVDLRNKIAHRGGPPEESVLKRHAHNGLNLINRLADISPATVDGQLAATTGKPLIERWNINL
jgi:RiboL-PSP-HEPN